MTQKRLSVVEEDRNPQWKSKKGMIAMSSMDNEYLQTAKLNAMKRILLLHNKICILDKLIEQLDHEATQRGITLKDLDEVKKMGEFFKKRKKEKQTIY